MSFLPFIARPLLDPVDGVAAAVEGRRWVVPLLIVMACVSLTGVAIYARWDPSPRVLAELTSSGELSRMTEQELMDKIQTTQRVALVAGVSKGVFFMPLAALLIAVALKVSGWLVGRKTQFARCFVAAVIALLPIGVYYLVYAACAFHQVVITDAQLSVLLPSSLGALFPSASVKVGRVLHAVEFFNLWSAALLGLGFSAASGMKKGRAVILGFVLYVLYAAVFLVGLPGMGGGGK